MLVTLLGLILLLGLMVWVFWLGSPSFLVLCTGLLVLLTWLILGFPFLELLLLILFEQWAGHRLLSDKVTGPHVRARRFNFVSFYSCVRGN